MTSVYFLDHHISIDYDFCKHELGGDIVDRNYKDKRSKASNVFCRMLSGVKKLYVYNFTSGKFTVRDGIEMTHMTKVASCF